MTSIEQAGAIVVRANGSEPLILLVTSRRNPGHWIFPKGHVERGETFEQAAVREAEEEAGVVGTLVGAAGALTFQLEGITFRVQYFVLTTSDEGAPERGRQLAWFPFERALDRVTFDDMRRLLITARPLVLEAAGAS